MATRQTIPRPVTAEPSGKRLTQPVMSATDSKAVARPTLWPSAWGWAMLLLVTVLSGAWILLSRLQMNQPDRAVPAAVRLVTPTPAALAQAETSVQPIGPLVPPHLKPVGPEGMVPKDLNRPMGVKYVPQNVLYDGLVRLGFDGQKVSGGGTAISPKQRERLVPLLREALRINITLEAWANMYSDGVMTVLTESQRSYIRLNGGQPLSTPDDSNFNYVLTMLRKRAGGVAPPPATLRLQAPKWLMNPEAVTLGLVCLEGSINDLITEQQARRILAYALPYLTSLQASHDIKRKIVAVLNQEQVEFINLTWKEGSAASSGPFDVLRSLDAAP